MGNKISKFKQMLNGYVNLLKKKGNVQDSEIEKVAQMRYSKCLECPEKKGENCSACGCLLAAKVRSLDASCPIYKW